MYENEQSESDETNSKLSSSINLKDICETCSFAFESKSTHQVGKSIYAEVCLLNFDEITNPKRNYEEVHLMKTFSKSTKSSTKDSAFSTPKAEEETILDETYQLAADAKTSETATADSDQSAQNENVKDSIKDSTEAREISETTVNILYEEYRSEPTDIPKSKTGEKNDITPSGKDSKATLDILACISHNDHKDDACENIEKATDIDNNSLK